MSDYDDVQPIHGTCKECLRPFVITAEEQAYLNRLATEKPEGARDNGWQWPKRCTSCRALRRAALYPTQTVDPNAGDEWLTCVSCSSEFVFGGRDRAYFASRGWTAPRRCKPCRQLRKETQVSRSFDANQKPIGWRGRDSR